MFLPLPPSLQDGREDAVLFVLQPSRRPSRLTTIGFQEACGQGQIRFRPITDQTIAELRQISALQEERSFIPPPFSAIIVQKVQLFLRHVVAEISLDAVTMDKAVGMEGGQLDGAATEASLKMAGVQFGEERLPGVMGHFSADEQLMGVTPWATVSCA